MAREIGERQFCAAQNVLGVGEADVVPKNPGAGPEDIGKSTAIFDGSLLRPKNQRLNDSVAALLDLEETRLEPYI
jgi:hypothetical protein